RGRGRATAPAHCTTGAQGGATGGGDRFFQASLHAGRRIAESQEAWRRSVYTEVLRQTQREDNELSIERACELARVSRAGYYRAWEESEPRHNEIALRDRLQQLSLAYPQNGSRRLTALLRIEGWVVNRKRVQRLMREDNLLVLRKRRYVATTDSRHTYAVYPNLARDIQP